MYMKVYVYICIRFIYSVYIYMKVYMCIYVFVYKVYMSIEARAFIYGCLCVFICVRTCLCIYTCFFIYTCLDI